MDVIRQASVKLGKEPVTLPQAFSAALIATINVLSILFDWSNDLTAALNLMAAAWVMVVAVWSRSKVSPVSG